MATVLVRRLSATALALSFAAGATACIINFGGDDEPCATLAVAATFLVNPVSLACEDHTPICGCGGCDPDETPTWGFCQSECTGLGQQACANTTGCRQAWDETCLLTDAICTLPDNGYYGCFATDMTGPIQGSCQGLGAVACSLHDDCLAVYSRDARCSNGTDDDSDGLVDENDECLTFVLCMDEGR